MHLFFEQLSPSSQVRQAAGSGRDQVRVLREQVHLQREDMSRLLPGLVVGEEAGRRVTMPRGAPTPAPSKQLSPKRPGGVERLLRCEALLNSVI